MKGVIPTPDIAKIFHPTPDIKAKNARHRHSKFIPTLATHLPKDGEIPNYTKSTLDTVIFKSTPETVKYLTSTLDTDPPFKGPTINILG